MLSASLHHAHFFWPALVHAHAMTISRELRVYHDGGDTKMLDSSAIAELYVPASA
jgi:hypothetical protein